MSYIKNILQISLYLSFLLLYSNCSSEGVLFPLNAKSPLKDFLNPVCDKSEYQFAYYKSKHKRYKAEELKTDQDQKIGYIIPEAINLEYQTISLLKPSNKFPNHPRTVFFKYQTEGIQKLDSKYKVEEEFITDKQYMVNFRPAKTLSTVIKDALLHNHLIKTTIYRDANLIWKLLKKAERMEFIDTLTRFQKFNHMPFHPLIHNKRSLYQHFAIMQEKFPKDYDYMPKTYILPLKGDDLKKFKNYVYDENDMWIYKPSSEARGKGIKLLTDNTIPKKGLLSKYIHNPYLIKGHKFDMRVYVLVTGFAPLKLYIFEDGLARFAGDEYSTAEKDNKNNFKHLTNYAVNKKAKGFVQNQSVDQEAGLKWTLSTLKRHMEKEGIDFKKKIWDQVEDILTKTFISYIEESYNFYKNFTILNDNLFEMYGADILIDSNLKAWLMEVNVGPSLQAESKLDYKVKSDLITDVFNIIGIIPYSHNYNKESMDYYPTFESIEQENVYNAFCEFERPSGHFKRVFPRKSNIDKYSHLFSEKCFSENQMLWKYMKQFDYE